MTLIQDFYRLKQQLQTALDSNPSAVYKVAPGMRDKVSPKQMTLEVWVKYINHDGETGYKRLDDYYAHH